MIAFLLVRLLVPIYLFGLLLLCLRLVSKLLSKELKPKKFLDKFNYSFFWFILVFSEKGRKKFL